MFISAGEEEKESMEQPRGTQGFRRSLGAADVALWKYDGQGWEKRKEKQNNKKTEQLAKQRQLHF